MIEFFKKRRLRKQLKEYLHAARHARHMREDIADQDDLLALDKAEQNIDDIIVTGKGDIEQAVKTLAAATDKVYPAANRTAVHENVEVIIVALGAAMAIRAFFVQPFKIPTGSMQPTLNGIIATQQTAPAWYEKQPFEFVTWLLTGESYKVIRAKSSGTLSGGGVGRDSSIVYINDVPHKIPAYMKGIAVLDYDHVYEKGEILIPGPRGKEIPTMAAGRIERVVVDQQGDYVLTIGGVAHTIPAYLLRPNSQKYYTKGDPIWAGKVVAGDHILVNKMKYNFMRPQRGDIAVFDTRNIAHEQVRKDTFYIKRMVGLPGEKIQIQNGRIVADGNVVSNPPVFEKIATDPAYHGGHGNAGILEDPNAFIELPDDEYLMCGDNTLPNMSLDGRFFGGVPRTDFQGPAFLVYWPFREHWGIVH